MHKQIAAPDLDQDEEISLGDLARSLWRSRVWALSGTAIGVVVFGGAMFIQFAATPEIQAFRQDISLMLDNGSYPNGTAFSTNDLRSPMVIERVHSEAELEAFGISQRDLSAGLSITPSSATYDGVVERYRARLADTALTWSERQQIEAEFGEALSSALAAGASVDLVLPPGRALPTELGVAVVRAVPTVWADVYINQLGVLNLPIPDSTTDLIDPQFLSSLDYPLAYDALVSSLDTISDRIDTAISISGTQNLSAPGSERTLFDIRRDMDQIERYSLDHVLAPLAELGLNKSPEITIAAYRYQIENLTRRMDLAKNNAAVVDSALAARGTGAPATPLVAGAAGPEQSGGTLPVNNVVQQFGPELVDRLVTMSIENASVDFRETLIQRKLDFEREALELSSQRDRIEHRLSLISGESVLENSDVLADIFTTETQRLATELNTAWRDIDAILAQANAERISQDKALFKFLPTPQAASTNRDFFDRRTAIFLVGGAMAGLVLGIAAYFLAHSARRTPASV
jgi:hypothetical protein